MDFIYEFETKIKDDINLWSEEVDKLELDTCWSEILKTQSITKYLRNLNSDFSVELIFFNQKDMSVFDFKKPLIREVYLKLGDERVVFARSMCSKDSKFWVDTLDCKVKPLGEILFSEHISLKREPFLYAKFDNFPARCSSFIYEGENMLLFEYFLPSLKKYL